MSLKVLNSPPRRATGCTGCEALLLVIVAAAIIVPGTLLFSNTSSTVLKTDTWVETSEGKMTTYVVVFDQCWGGRDDDNSAEHVNDADVAFAESNRDNDEADATPVAARRPFDPPPGVEWTSLFNGEDLTGWTITNFGGQGPVEVVDGELHLGFGQSMTGVTIDKQREIPHINYEVQMTAMRVDGRDFFCGMTFPVKDDPCSLILGGWGGGVCGLSSLDFLDASENETTSYREFQNGRWYHIRVRVQEHRIDVWLDGERIIKQRIVGRKIGIRPEVHLSIPFGLATYETTAAIKNLCIRPLAESEIDED